MMLAGPQLVSGLNTPSLSPGGGGGCHWPSAVLLGKALAGGGREGGGVLKQATRLKLSSPAGGQPRQAPPPNIVGLGTRFSQTGLGTL